jgi:hypothetical protein
MRLLAALVALLAATVVSSVVTACGLLSRLADVDFPIAPLVRGDLRPVFASHAFWAAFPGGAHPELLLRFGPAACVLLLAIGLRAAASRYPSLPAPVWALAMLAAGVVPYTIGAVALRDNTVEAATGQWLLWQLLGPLYAALLALVGLARWCWPRRTALANVPQPTPA